MWGGQGRRHSPRHTIQTDQNFRIGFLPHTLSLTVHDSWVHVLLCVHDSWVSSVTLDRIDLTNLPGEKTERTFTAMVACLLRWLLSCGVIVALSCCPYAWILPLLWIVFAKSCCQPALLCLSRSLSLSFFSHSNDYIGPVPKPHVLSRLHGAHAS